MVFEWEYRMVYRLPIVWGIMSGSNGIVTKFGQLKTVYKQQHYRLISIKNKTKNNKVKRKQKQS